LFLSVIFCYVLKTLHSGNFYAILYIDVEHKKYQDSIMAIKSSGTYPIGLSGCWHGGIHNHGKGNGWVYSLLGGNAIACKVQEKYYGILYYKDINADQYSQLNEEEKEKYTESENNPGHYHAEEPPERDCSTSYVLLEHTIKVPNVEEGTKKVDLTFNFFTLYIHLLPYGVWEIERVDFGRLPFYLKWGTFTVNRVGKEVRYFEVGENRIYDGTKYIIVNSKIFHQSEELVKNGRIAIEMFAGKKSNNDKLQIDVPSSFIKDKKLIMKLKPLKGKVIEFYDVNISYYAHEFTLLGKIKETLPDNWRVIFDKEGNSNINQRMNQINYIRITIKDNNDKIEDCPKGIIKGNFDKKGHGLKGSLLYEENPVTEKFFKAVPIETYTEVMKPDSNDLELLKQNGFVTTLGGKDYIIINLPNAQQTAKQNNCDFFISFKNNIIDNPSLEQKLISLNIAPFSISLAGRGEDIYLYQLRKKIQVAKEYDMKEITPKSKVAGFTAVQIYFTPNKEFKVIADASNFELLDDERVTGMLSIPSDEGSQEEGIPCYNNGYIRGLLHKDDTFTLADRDGFYNNDRIMITKIKDFTQSMECSITYIKDEIDLESGVVINGTRCQKITRGEEKDICVIKQGYEEPIYVNAEGLIGMGGRFEGQEKFYHVETFFTDDKLIQDLFNKKYTLNRYHVTKNIDIYEKKMEEGYKLYFPALMEWSLRATVGNYALINLEKLALYFKIGDVEKKENGKFIIKNKKMEVFYVQEETVKINDTREEYKKYCELMKIMLLENKEFTREPENENNEFIRGLYFESDDLLNFGCWIEKGLLNNKNGFTEIKKDLYFVPGPKRLKCDIYTVYPADKYPEQFIKNDKKLEASFFGLEEEQGSDNMQYARFKDKDGSTYYCKSASLQKENVLDWCEKFYKIDSLDYGDGIYCNDINAALGLGIKVTDQNQGRQSKPFSDNVQDKLRNRVCKFPMEWNKELQKERSNGRTKEIFSRADVWNEIYQKIKAEKDAHIWHVHPEYFGDYVNDNLIHDINPYKGKEFEHRQATRDDGGGALIKKTLDRVTSNPGFATRYKLDEKLYDYEGNNFDGFAVLTGFFNQQYHNNEQDVYPHEGVDFRGKAGTEVVSFIHGEVIFAGTLNSTYGNSLIIKPLYEDGIVYLVAHLSNEWLVKEEEIIKPYRVVAKVGADLKAPHLHVSVLATKLERKNDIVEDTNGNGKYTWKMITRDYRDPFNHDIQRERQ
jgi:murein DD-endopeptidase MepM/ murein hydrolase activator NlpD